MKSFRSSWLLQLLLTTLLLASGSCNSGPVHRFQPNNEVRKTLSKSQQLILSIVPEVTSTDGTLYFLERSSQDNKWRFVLSPMRASVGRNGLAWGRSEINYGETIGALLGEWDLRSPAGIFRLGPVFQRQSMGSIKYQPISIDDYCVDDPSSNFYNQIVSKKNVAVDWKSAEPMSSYEFGIVIMQNPPPVQKSHGSCIFLHPGPASGGNNGCTTLDRETFVLLLNWIDLDKTPLLIQLTRDNYNLAAAVWKLPVLDR